MDLRPAYNLLVLKTPPSGAGFMTSAQRRYLARGLKQPGGKLPLFDDEGQEISHRTIEICVVSGCAIGSCRGTSLPVEKARTMSPL